MGQLRKYYLSSFIGSSIPAFIILVLLLWSLGILLWAYALPVWLLSGFFAGQIGSRFAGSQEDLRSYIATALLGFVIAFLAGLLVIFTLF